MRLRDLGNTVIVVEHDEETIRVADHVVDIGPGAGEHGGEIVYAGNVAGLLEEQAFGHRAVPVGCTSIEIPECAVNPATRGSSCGRARAQPQGHRRRVPARLLRRGHRRERRGQVDARQRHPLPRADAEDLPLAHAGPPHAIDGVEHVDKVIDIDQRPIGRTPRSNPATYTGVFDKIRKLFAQTPEAKVRGYQAGRFSFNVKGGRCEACEGDGMIKIEMHFLPDVYVPCEVCKGERYNRDTLEITWQGHSIADVLDMTCEEALEMFRNQPADRATAADDRRRRPRLCASRPAARPRCRAARRSG